MILSEIELNNGIRPWPSVDLDAKGITSDSRQVSEGTVFAAWQGEHVDGHDYILDAVSKGAVAILHEQTLTDAPPVPCFHSNSIRRDYSHIAYQLAGLLPQKMTLIGITGTNGKTTTTQLVAQLLRGLGKKVGTIGTLGAEVDSVVFREGMTTPPAEVVASDLNHMLAQGVEICVMEVSSHALSQERLFGLKFSVAAWTNLTPEHLDFHGTMEAYAAAKARLFHEFCDVRENWVLNLDDPKVAKFAELDAFTFSQSGGHPDATLRIECESFNKNRTRCQLHVGGRVFDVESPLIGSFNLQNLAAALGVVTRLGFSFDKAMALVPGLSGIPGRMELVSRQDEPLVVVDYAHTPDALLKALTTLKALPHKSLICVFGCGGDRDQDKRPMMGRLAAENADRIFVTNDNPRTESPTLISDMIEAGIPSDAESQYNVVLDRELAIQSAIESADLDDVILIAGKGHETYQINGTEVVDFDDRKIARNYLNKKFAN